MQETNRIVEYDNFEDFTSPKIVYKYRTWSDKFHRRFITKKEIYLASPESFKDKLDCHNPMRFDLLTKEQIYHYYLWSFKKLNPNFTSLQHKLIAINNTKNYLTNNKPSYNFQDTIRLLNEHQGILSLTEDSNNQAMWDEYADFDKGICIGYDAKELFKYLGGGGPVIYTDKIPITLPFPIMEFTEIVRNQIFYKLNEFSYEKEYRTHKFWKIPATILDRQIVVPASVFKKVIFGNKISKKNREEIEKSILNNIGEIEIVDRKTSF